MANRLDPIFDIAFGEQFRTLLSWRRDVRHFRADPVAEELLEDLLAMATLAPSVGLSQPWRFVTVDDAARRMMIRQNFAEANAQALTAQSSDRAALYARLKLAGLDEAPCHLAVFADPEPVQGHGLGRGTMPETAAYSAVMAVHTLWLAARIVGLGLGWVSILDPATVTAALEVPTSWIFIGYFCLGYPQFSSETPELETAKWESRQPLATKLIRR